MSVNTLELISFKTYVEEDSKHFVEQTLYKYVIALDIENVEEYNMPICFLHDTLEYFYINLSWDRTTLVTHLRTIPDENGKVQYEPFFGEGKILDHTSKVSYIMLPDVENPRYASCKIFQNFDIPPLRRLQFTLNVKYRKYSLEKISAPDSSLYARLEKIYNNIKERDVQITVNGNEYFAHMAIIAKCSTLYNMAKRNSKKEIKNSIEINNLKPNIFLVLLKYLYLGETDEINFGKTKNDFLYDLIRAAELYQISDLKRDLIYKTMQRLNIKNVIDIFIFADENKVQNLKEICMKFILLFGKDISDVIAFQKLVNYHTSLSQELLIYIYQN